MTNKKYSDAVLDCHDNGRWFVKGLTNGIWVEVQSFKPNEKGKAQQMVDEIIGHFVKNTSKLRNIRTWKRVAEKLFSRGCMYEVKSECTNGFSCIACWAEYINENKDNFK